MCSGQPWKGQTCPVVHEKDWCSPEESKSACWSPGESDYDCPDNGICCFDGCSNQCGIPTPDALVEVPVTLAPPVTTTTPACTTVLVDKNETVEHEMCAEKPGPEVCTSVWEDQCKDDCKNVDKPEEVCTPESKWVEDKVCKNVTKTQTCPVVSARDWCSPEESNSVCWSPGQNHCPDCPDNGICCFNGCSNQCGVPVCKPVCESVESKECQPGQPGPDVCHTVWEDQCKDECKNVDKTEEVCDTVWDQECTEKPCEPVTETVNKIEKECVSHPEECHTVPEEVCSNVTETVCEAATKVCHSVWMSGGECGREIVCEKELGKECKTIAQKWKRSLKWHKAKKDKKICWPAKVEKCYWAPKNCLKEVCKDEPACHEVTKPSCSLVDREECVPAREMCVDVTKQVQVQSTKHCPVPPQQDCSEVENQVCKNVTKTDWVCNPVCKAVERQECQPGQPGPDVCTSVWEDECKDECNGVEKPEEVCTSEWNEVQNTVCKVVTKTDWVCTPVCEAVERKDCQPGKPVKNCWKVPKTITYKVPKKVCSSEW